MKNNSKVLIMILFICIFTNLVLAYGEEKNEEGNKSLYLEETMPKDSSKDVPMDAVVKLLFNKNVVNFSIKDNNASCFSIVDENNKEVPIDIIFPDDQIEPEKKREITIKARESFKESTTYTVNISSKLMAKNGNTLGENISLSFTTVQLSNNKTDGIPIEKSVEKPSEKPINANAEPSKPEEIKTDIEDTETNKDKAITALSSNISEEEVKEEIEETSLDESNDINNKAESSTENINDDLDNEDNSSIAIESDDIEEETNSLITYILPILIIALVFIIAIRIKGKKMKQ